MTSHELAKFLLTQPNLEVYLSGETRLIQIKGAARGNKIDTQTGLHIKPVVKLFWSSESTDYYDVD